ncbi:hypothetical protein BDV96DRAFT_639455 [Lophiotrema nucula]|uniref:Uncharacterized protein n=1 Tax=Lophiotrema nucula TaxID=690887 RepID=A0A6A5ZX84_9PLEO|nr:hypothetical protein BDV96DRAFT_639455 [Lophiotrema nucula]
MVDFNFEDLDTHISQLQSQLSFLAAALHSTDHTTPEWITTDLVGLRNATGRLRDGMRGFQTKLDAEGVRTRKEGRKRTRLSIEGAKAQEQGSNGSNDSKPSNGDDAQPTYPDLPQTSDPQPKPEPAQTSDQAQQEDESGYTPQFLDISSLVEQRVHARRLQSLIDSPRTAQKRKRLILAEQDTVFGLEDEGNGDGDGERSRGGSPVKKVKAWGQFEQVLKRKDGVGNDEADGWDGSGDGGGGGRKRQRL